MTKRVLETLQGKASFPPPIWMMRQAGRYLPEYKATRKEAGSFLDLCYSPEHAIEVTMQPIRRFGFDAAILFSDILVVPDALGQDVRFEEGRGPVLKPVDVEGIVKLDQSRVLEHLQPVFETVKGIRAALDDEKTLIGFCGAPWTVATYMIAGHGTPDQAPARLFAMRERAAFDQLLDVLVDASATYLIEQVKYGADCLQIFDTWAGVLGEQDFEDFCVQPMKRIVDKVRAVYPDMCIIGFPRGAGVNYAGFAKRTGVNGVGIDWMVPLSFVAESVAGDTCVQGNLDPLLLINGGSKMTDQTVRICEAFKGKPHIFNLGHGITPTTPISNVETMIEAVRSLTS